MTRRRISLLPLALALLAASFAATSGCGLPPSVDRDVEATRARPAALTFDPSAGPIVFWGDSITANGHYVGWTEAYLSLLLPDVAFRFYNAGLGGNSVTTALGRLQPEVVAQKPSLVVVAFGMNDGRFAPMYDNKLLDEFEYHLGVALQTLRSKTEAKVVVLSPPHYDVALRRRLGIEPLRDYYPFVLDRYDVVAKRVAAKHGATYVDVLRPLRAAAAACDEQRYACPISDGIHPTSAGGVVMATALLRALVKDAGAARVQLDKALIPARAGSALVDISVAWTGAWKPLASCLARQGPRLSDAARALAPSLLLAGTGALGARYEVFVEGERIGELSASALADGGAALRLATRACPWWLGSVAALVEERRAIVHEQIRLPLLQLKEIHDPALRARAFGEARQFALDRYAAADRVLEGLRDRAALRRYDMLLRRTR